MRDTRKSKGSKVPRGTAKVGKSSPSGPPAAGGRDGAPIGAPAPPPRSVVADSATVESASADRASAPEFATAQAVSPPDGVPVPLDAALGVDRPTLLPSGDTTLNGPRDLFSGLAELAVTGVARTTDEWLVRQDRLLGLAHAQREVHLAMLQTMLGETSLAGVFEAQARVAGQVIDVAASHWIEMSGAAQRLLGGAAPTPDMESR